MDFATIIGLVAAFCTTVSYYPQLKKCWNRLNWRSLLDDVSNARQRSGALGGYGFLKSDMVIILANATSWPCS
jgi:MtN3 and saliva related transmembrane protein